jgi:hypothetical protein
MAEYVREHCNDCGRILPRNELTPWTEQVLVGQTTGTYASGRTKYRSDYRVEHGFLCSECIGKRAAAAAAARRRSAIAWGTMVVVIVIAIGVLRMTSCSAGSVESSAASAPPTDQPVAESDGAPAASAQSDQAAAVADAPTAESEVALSSPPDGAETPAPADTRPDAAADDYAEPSLTSITPSNEPRLSASLLHALDTGQPTSWYSRDGQTYGVVVVSALELSVDRVCESYRFTANRRGANWTAPDAVICRQAGHMWRPPE